MTCSVSSVVHQAKRHASNAEDYAQNILNRLHQFEIDTLSRLDRMIEMSEKPAEAVQVQSEENARDYFMVKMETALNRGLISREQFTPMFEHFFGPAPLVDEGEVVDASYHEVEEGEGR